MRESLEPASKHFRSPTQPRILVCLSWAISPIGPGLGFIFELELELMLDSPIIGSFVGAVNFERTPTKVFSFADLIGVSSFSPLLREKVKMHFSIASPCGGGCAKVS